MTVYEWLKTLELEQLACILTELYNGKYNCDNLDMNFTIRYQYVIPCLGEKNDIKEWLSYTVEKL